MSFGASAVILIIGIISNYKAQTFPQRIFALIPLFFSIQQFIEGLLWLVLANPEYDFWRPMLTNFYLSFAWIIWPAFIPFAMGLLEANPTCKKIFHWFTADYKPSYPWIFTIMYLIATVISLLLSSTRKIWIFGIVNLASYLFTKIFFHGHVVSIWCFFGAISSFIILWIILDLTAQNEKEEYALSEQL